MMGMNLKGRWMALAGTLVAAGILGTGVALAATGGGAAALTDKLQAAVQSGKLTQAEADVMQQLANLRKAAMEKLKADEKALIDQAVKDGKLTQDQAKKLTQRLRRKHHGGRHGHMGGKWKNLTPEQMKAKLDEAVKSGKLTQEQADKIMERWNQRHNGSSGQEKAKP
jgi:polyhydroxyalkanoate synthesis regulator phasin